MNENTFFSRLLVVIIWFIVANTAQAVTCQNNIPATNPDSVYTVDHTKGTVTDTRTGLMWKTCSEGQTWTGSTCSGDASWQTWSEALNGAAASTFASYSDWRVPDLKELMSLAEDCRIDPAINDTVFPNTSSWFWSGSPDANGASVAWGVDFDYGLAYSSNRNDGYHVRLVRGGQSFDSFDSLNVNKTGNGSGSVTSNPAGINCGAICAADFDSGSEITLTAAPDANSTFSGWSGACTNKTGNCVVTMTKAQTVTATFTAKPVNFSLAISKVGNGTITSSDSKINCGTGSGCVGTFASGSKVVLTANPASGYEFSNWSGACSGSGACSVTMNKEQTVTATFIKKTVNYQLTVKTAGSGTVNSSDGSINCNSASCSANFVSGSNVILTATPASGFTFVSWSGCTASAANKLQCQFDLTANKTVTATFAAIPPSDNTLTVKTIGNGSVTSTPDGINCGTDCNEIYPSASQVLLTAKPASGATFSGWSGGGCSGKELTCLVKMTTETTVTATFTTPDYILTVNKIGNGSVFSTVLGIDCGTDCTERYAGNTTVTLIATPFEGEHFISWKGCVPNSTEPEQCRVNLTGTTEVTATFSEPSIDVRVMSIDLNPVMPIANKTFTAQITVKNVGTLELNAGNLEVWLDNTQFQTCGATGDKWASIGKLAAGATKTVSVQLTATSKGQKNLHTFVDSQCVTKELHEGNNQAIKRYTVN